MINLGAMAHGYDNDHRIVIVIMIIISYFDYACLKVIIKLRFCVVIIITIVIIIITKGR